MKKRNKILLLGLSILGFNLMNVNAETLYTEQKKYTLTEIENKDKLVFDDFIKYNDKLLITGMKQNQEGSTIYSLTKHDDKYTLESYDKTIDFEEFYNTTNKKYISYNSETNELNIKIKENVIDTLTLKKGEHLIDANNTYLQKYITIYNENDNNLYFYNSSKISDKDIIKKIDVKKLYDKLNFDYENSTAYTTNFNIQYYDDKTEPYIEIDIDTFSDKIENTVALFDTDEKLITSKKFDENSNYNTSIIINTNEGFKIAYSTWDEANDNCKLYIVDNNNDKLLLDTNYYISINFINGFFIVTETSFRDDGESNRIHKTTIYDNKINIIKEYKEILVNNIRKISEKGSNTLYNSSNIINDTYLVEMTDNNEDEIYSILDVKDLLKVTITGNVKDKDGNPLKNVIVELHSTPRTFTTDEDGYFKFDNVEEGKHTLIIKKSDGTVIATKEINVIESTETKLDGDTLYFNSADKGFNLNIKVDGDKLTIDSIDKSTKEQEKTIKEKLEDVVVPKTFDGIIRNIIILGILLFAGIYLLKKNNRIKVTNIK